MLIGVPKEIKTHEYRVGLIPGSVRELVHHGHQVVVEKGAGAGIGFDDAAYQKAGARVLATAADVFAAAEMVVKVKEPQPPEIAMLRKMFASFENGEARAHLDEYSEVNIEFHQTIILMSNNHVLIDLAANLFTHMRMIRRKTIGEKDRADRSIRDHINIIEAIEARDTDRAEKLVRDHALGEECARRQHLTQSPQCGGLLVEQHEIDRTSRDRLHEPQQAHEATHGHRARGGRRG